MQTQACHESREAELSHLSASYLQTPDADWDSTPFPSLYISQAWSTIMHHGKKGRRKSKKRKKETQTTVSVLPEMPKATLLKLKVLYWHLWFHVQHSWNLSIAQKDIYSGIRFVRLLKCSSH